MTEPIRATGPTPPEPSVEPERTVVSTPPVPAGQIALDCLAKFDGVALVLAGVARATPAILLLGGIKAGLEVGECVAKALDENAERASIKSQIDACAAAGGTPIGVLDGQVSCAVPTAR